MNGLFERLEETAAALAARTGGRRMTSWWCSGRGSATIRRRWTGGFLCPTTSCRGSSPRARWVTPARLIRSRWAAIGSCSWPDAPTPTKVM